MRATALWLSLLWLGVASAETVRGTLGGPGQRQVQGRFVHEHPVELASGQTVRARLSSQAFDAYLRLVAPDGRVLREVDDAQAGSSDAALEFAVADAGTYRLECTSFGGLARGAFTLEVEVSRGAPSPASGVAQVFEGQLRADGPRLPTRRRGEQHVFGGRAGEPVRASLESDAFDTVLVLEREDGTEVERNDDRGDGTTHSLLELELPADGRYRWVCMGYAEDARGSYQLSMSLGGDGRPMRERVWDGTLSEDSPPIYSQRLVGTHTWEAEAGTSVRFTLDSDDFDPLLILQGPNGDELERNDDRASGDRTAEISYHFASAGTYTLLCTSYGNGSTGAYRLEATPDAAAPEPAEPTLPPLAGAETRAGRLEQGDDQLGSGEFIDWVELEFASPVSLDLRLSSREFDAWLIVLTPSGEQWGDDDGGDGTDARLVRIAQEPGTYRVGVTTYRPQEGGAYTLAWSTEDVEADVQARARPLGASSVVEDRLAAGDALRSGREFVDWYTVEVCAGQSLGVKVESAEFDPVVVVESPSGRHWENDDRSSDTRDAALTIAATEGGLYRVGCTSFAPRVEGAYRLSWEVRGGAQGPEPAEPEGGELAASDEQLPSGEFIDWMDYEVEAPGVVWFHMESDEFYPYVMVRGRGGEHWDADGGRDPSGNAHLSVDFERAGTYRVGLTSHRPGARGAYRLRVEPGVPLGTAWARPYRGANRQFYGIFVGISDYPGQSNDLPECRQDAEKLGRTLVDTGLASQSTIDVLVDRQATRANLRRAFERMRQRVGPEDVFVFFYSGHGQQDEVRNEQLDPRIEPDLREDYLQLYDGMVGDDTLAGWLHGIDSHLVICCLDCCFSGGFARDVVSRPNVLGLFSSEEDLTSAVAEGFQAGGYLSVFFREALTGLADQNGDGQIHVGELCHFLQSEFAENVSAEKAITTGGHSAWQHLVVERGGVTVQTPLVER